MEKTLLVLGLLFLTMSAFGEPSQKPVNAKMIIATRLTVGNPNEGQVLIDVYELCIQGLVFTEFGRNTWRFIQIYEPGTAKTNFRPQPKTCK